MIDFYRVLGLPFGASVEQVRKAYREYAKHFHPDRHQNSTFFTERFKEIQRAYEVLTDAETRGQFERSFNFDNRSNEVALLNKELADLKEKFAQQAKELSESNIQIQNLRNQLGIKDSKSSTRDSKVNTEDKNGKKRSWSSTWKRYREIRNARQRNEVKVAKKELTLKEEFVLTCIAIAIVFVYMTVRDWLR